MKNDILFPDFSVDLIFVNFIITIVIKNGKIVCKHGPYLAEF